jgi:hypothetical protein
MSEAPLKREKQIKLMTEAAKRRQERIARWSSDGQLKAVLREPAPSRNVTATYTRSDSQLRRHA